VGEYELTREELPSVVRLHWNKEMGILQGQRPTVEAALQLPNVQKWFEEKKDEKYRDLDSHLILANGLFNHGAVTHNDGEYEAGCSEDFLATIDGIHRSLAWAKQRRTSIRVIIAGNPLTK